MMILYSSKTYVLGYVNRLPTSSNGPVHKLIKLGVRRKCGDNEGDIQCHGDRMSQQVTEDKSRKNLDELLGLLQRMHGGDRERYGEEVRALFPAEDAAKILARGTGSESRGDGALALHALGSITAYL